jgi:hypothetical protein
MITSQDLSVAIQGAPCVWVGVLTSQRALTKVWGPRRIVCLLRQLMLINSIE